MSESNAIDYTANPAPLGLLGFGMTTVLLNMHNAGFFPLDTMILAMGIFYGGLAQVIAGIMEWKKGNTFACTAFTSYGMFWLSLVALVVLLFLAGLLARNVAGKRLYDLGDKLLARIPVINKLYVSIRQISETLLDS